MELYSRSILQANLSWTHGTMHVQAGRCYSSPTVEVIFHIVCHVSAGPGRYVEGGPNCERLPLHALSLKDDNSQASLHNSWNSVLTLARMSSSHPGDELSSKLFKESETAIQSLQVGGTAKSASGNATISTTPSKVLRSGKRIPPSTTKKPKALSKLNDGRSEEVLHLLSGFVDIVSPVLTRLRNHVLPSSGPWVRQHSRCASCVSRLSFLV